MASIVARFSNAVIVHSHAAKEIVERNLHIRANRVYVIPHGHYIGAYRNRIADGDARRTLGIHLEDTVFLFFGNIRRYKGVVDLVAAFKKSRIRSARLVIAGQVADDVRTGLEAAIAGEPNVKLFGTRIPNESVQFFFNSADAVVFPYRDTLTSGAVVLAMSFGRACIVPASPVMHEVVGAKAGLFFESCNIDDLALCLSRAAASGSELRKKGAAALARCERWTWGEVAKATREVYGWRGN
jgi:glycosyltransferase involved in cell wall biosynthesis